MKNNIHPGNIKIEDYNYDLPETKIAFTPAEPRDASKLLVYKNSEITVSTYCKIANFISSDSLMVFNDTKVIHARIIFQKPSGGKIEIFCLEPYGSFGGFEDVMSQKACSYWICMVGGASKWKDKTIKKTISINGITVELNAEIIERAGDKFVIKFYWVPAHFTFADIIHVAGFVPLPPYIKRNVEETDEQRYQTVYARQEGSVAAPTAGLHFSKDVFNSLKHSGITIDYITLHVGAGTFKPVSSNEISGHEMHPEWIDVSASTIKNILKFKNVVAIGTTSVRTIESLYWLGVKLANNDENLNLSQWEVYEKPLADTKISVEDSLSHLLKYLSENKLDKIFTQTKIIIAPGYNFKIVKAIVTNFHQPKSTLLLLIAAALGEKWQEIYEFALQNDFRFLSYGDGSLLYVDQG